MENSRPSSSESDGNDTQESVGSTRRSSEFLTYYQRLLGRRPSLEDALNPTESEDDEEEADEKPKKWRGFFKRLFGNVVTPPGTENEQRAENQHGFNPDAWYSWQMAASSEAPTISPETDEQPDQTAEVPEVAIETATTPEAVETDTVLPELSDTTIEPAPLAELPNEPITEVEAVIEHSSSTPEAPQPVVERETVIERGIGGGLPLLLVGAEYIGRKRADKRIKKEFTQKLDTVEQKTSQQEVTQSQLETLIQQNRQQLETLKRERGMAEAQEQKPSQPTLETKPTLPPPEERVPTARILESVVDAAEHNVPVERIFERSHEVKDEPNVVGVSDVSNAQSVGAVMAAQMAGRQVPATQPQTNAAQGLPVVVDEQAAREMYAQAMKSGFIGAIMLIILGLLAYLVIQ